MRTILGICGSPRRDNTYLALREAGEGAGSVEGADFRIIELRSLRIEPCRGCLRCSQEGATAERPCPTHDDDFGPALAASLVEADALVMASPVYYGSVTGLVKNFMDRTEPLLRYSTSSLQFGLRNKVGGGIAVAGNRNGGQETTLQAIHHWMLIHDMIVVGTVSDGLPGCYLGAALTTYPVGRRPKAVREDTLGLAASRAVGRRVAEVASWVPRAAGRCPSSADGDSFR